MNKLKKTFIEFYVMSWWVPSVTMVTLFILLVIFHRLRGVATFGFIMEITKIPFLVLLLYFCSIGGIFIAGIYQLFKRKLIAGLINLLSFYFLGGYTLQLVATST